MPNSYSVSVGQFLWIIDTAYTEAITVIFHAPWCFDMLNWQEKNSHVPLAFWASGLHVVDYPHEIPAMSKAGLVPRLWDIDIEC